MPKSRPRPKTRDNARRGKKKVSVLTHERVEYIDYKDVNLLRRFISDRAKIRARRVTANDAHQQRTVARAIKNAREMALLPYANKITTQRGAGRSDGPRDGAPGRRGDRAPRPDEDDAPPMATADGAPLHDDADAPPLHDDADAPPMAADALGESVS